MVTKEQTKGHKDDNVFHYRSFISTDRVLKSLITKANDEQTEENKQNWI